MYMGYIYAMCYFVSIFCICAERARRRDDKRQWSMGNMWTTLQAVNLLDHQWQLSVNNNLELLSSGMSAHPHINVCVYICEWENELRWHSEDDTHRNGVSTQPRHAHKVAFRGGAAAMACRCSLSILQPYVCCCRASMAWKNSKLWGKTWILVK